MRLFIGVDVETPLRARIEEQVARLRRIAPEARWVNPQNSHLTLAFLGEVDERLVPRMDTLLANLALQHAPLTLTAAGGGTFGPMERPRVLWVPLGQDRQALLALQADLKVRLAELNQAPDHETFEPHLTLARCRHPQGDASLARCSQALQGVTLGTMQVVDIALFCSHNSLKGMHYSTVVRHPLQGTRGDSPSSHGMRVRD